MSEYQRYEWLTVDRPLTRAQLDEVNGLSSHIEASSTHAVIEYQWGDFKHDPVKVLYKYFDGFLYWANWGAPQLALRFPHGALPAYLLNDYDFNEVVTFTTHKDYDILDIQFGELEPPGEWVEYELGSLIGVREELMGGDLRSLYIVWLASQALLGDDYDDDNSYDDEEEEEEEEIDAPAVPPGFGKLTAAQSELAVLFRVPEELLVAVARHSSAAVAVASDDIDAWVKLLPAGRRDDYLMRLARNEPGLNRQLLQELRDLGRGKSSPPPAGERVTYETLIIESQSIKGQLERKRRERERELERVRREQEQQARQRYLQDVHEHQDTYWRQVDKDVARASASGYDAAARGLVDLRDSAKQFDESEQFQERFHVWFQSQPRRPALIRRLQERQIPL
jgi:hypothetical protein